MEKFRFPKSRLGFDGKDTRGSEKLKLGMMFVMDGSPADLAVGDDKSSVIVL